MRVCDIKASRALCWFVTKQKGFDVYLPFNTATPASGGNNYDGGVDDGDAIIMAMVTKRVVIMMVMHDDDITMMMIAMQQKVGAYINTAAAGMVVGAQCASR